MPVSLHSRGLLQCVFMGLPLKFILEVSASVIMSVLRFTHIILLLLPVKVLVVTFKSEMVQGWDTPAAAFSELNIVV